MQTAGGFQTAGGGAGQVKQRTLAAVALGAVAAIMAAFPDNGKFHRFFNKTNLLSMPDGSPYVFITATAGGTATDIKNISVLLTGLDESGNAQTETMPAFTLDTAGVVTSVKKWTALTQIEIPAHDGLGATTSIGISGAGAADVLPAFTSLAVAAVFKTATITNPAASRNVTATAGGTNTDVKAITPTVRGTNDGGAAISETLPAFTVDTLGTVTGSKSFKTITEIDLPVHDGTGATTSFGTGAKLGMGQVLARNSVLSAYLGNVREATLPTVVTDAANIDGNTFQLSSALNGSDVVVYYLDDKGD